MLKYHLMTAIGITLFVTFAYRLFMAVAAPGLGLQEAYLVGGMVISAFVIRNGFVGWRETRRIMREEV